MVARMLKKIVYFGIPVVMWVAGGACAPEQQAVAAKPAVYRCSRVGCSKIAEAPAASSAPACSCGSQMVLDHAEEDPRRLQWGK